MTDLIKITERDDQQVVSARELYIGLGYRAADYARWAKANITDNDFFLENEDWVLLGMDAENPNGGRPTQDYLISVEMAKSILLKIRHNDKSGEMLKQLDNTTTIHHTKSRFEHSFGGLLIKQLGVFCIECKCQYIVSGYRIDFFIPSLNVAIEYDECQHFTSANMQLDKKREDDIKSILGCKFIRVDWREDDAVNAAIILKEILTIKK